MNDYWEPDLGQFLDNLGRVTQVSEPSVDYGDWDVCAWYQPVDYFGLKWGIYIRQDCVLDQALAIAKFLDRDDWSKSNDYQLAKALIRSSLFVFSFMSSTTTKWNALA